MQAQRYQLEARLVGGKPGYAILRIGPKGAPKTVAVYTDKEIAERIRSVLQTSKQWEA